MKPYEKYKLFGAEALSDEELLAIIIRTGTKDCDSLAIAENVLASFDDNSLLGLYHCHWKELLKIAGIGEVKAIKLLCIAELSRRLTKTSFATKLQYTSPATVANYYMESLRHLEKEKVVLLCLDKKMGLLSEIDISIGTVSEAMLSPREIFLSALEYHAVHIIILHNHPSGDPSPSNADLQITMKIYKLGRMMNIPLMDHIIIGDNRYYSFRESGHFKE